MSVLTYQEKKRRHPPEGHSEAAILTERGTHVPNPRLCPLPGGSPGLTAVPQPQALGLCPVTPAVSQLQESPLIILQGVGFNTEVGT